MCPLGVPGSGKEKPEACRLRVGGCAAPSAYRATSIRAESPVKKYAKKYVECIAGTMYRRPADLAMARRPLYALPGIGEDVEGSAGKDGDDWSKGAKPLVGGLAGLVAGVYLLDDHRDPVEGEALVETDARDIESSR